MIKMQGIHPRFNQVTSSIANQARIVTSHVPDHIAARALACYSGMHARTHSSLFWAADPVPRGGFFGPGYGHN